MGAFLGPPLTRTLAQREDSRDYRPIPASSDFDLLPALQTCLTNFELTAPTEIQSLAIPILLAGRSIVGVAETGSGKTLAFALPILHALKTLEEQGDRITVEGRPRAVVLVPTRELGEQVAGREEANATLWGHGFGVVAGTFASGP
mgnify:CR=1 FL=1